VSLATSLLITAQNLYPTSSSPSNCIGHWSFTSLPDIILKGDGQNRTNKPDFWNKSPPSLLQLLSRQWSELLPLAEFAYNNTLIATTGIYTLLGQQGVIIRTSWFIPSVNLAFCMCPQLCHRPQPATPATLATHSWSPTSIPDIWLIPDDYRPQNSKLEAKYLSGFNISIQLNLWRNFWTNSWPVQSPCTPWHPFSQPTTPTWLPSSTIRYFMSQCWNQHSWIQFRIGFNLHPYPSLSKTNPNSKFLTSLIPRLTTDVAANFNILSNGWANKGTDEETSWINANELGNATELVADFHLAYPSKPGPLSNLWSPNYFIIIQVFTLIITSFNEVSLLASK